jgi:hypothetical protein
MNKLFTVLFFFIVLVSCGKRGDNNATEATTEAAASADSTKQVQLQGARTRNCLDVVTEILTSSPAYQKRTLGLAEAIQKNGGSSFGITLEGSPNPEKDQALNLSETYDFSLHETYEDRMPTIARYSFNPSEKKLYEYDVVNDQLIPIDFDKNLLATLSELCK